MQTLSGDEQTRASIPVVKKALTCMNIHLSNAISDLSGLSGQTIIRAILTGERDPNTTVL